MHQWVRDDLKRLIGLLALTFLRDKPAAGLRWLADQIEVKEIRRP